MTTPTSDDANETTSAAPRRLRVVWLTGVAVVAVAATAAAGVLGPGTGGADETTSNTRANGTTCGATTRTPVTQPTQDQMAASGLDELAVAADTARVDLVAAGFSRPTEITNPLFPIATLKSAVLNGTVDGEMFRTETTLLPETRTLEWAPGQCAKVLVSQYVAFLDGRIHEVALDFYAQADDGSVWYLGEDVYNYDEGLIADTHGTWLAGKEGPAAMIMPGRPAVGQVYRPENIAGLVFEEVTVAKVGETVDGPLGPAPGAVIVRELHDDGSVEEKTFAPGYGEFFTASGGDVEAMAVAIPVNAAPGGVPASLTRLSESADAAFRAATDGRWNDAGTAVTDARTAWQEGKAQAPVRLVEPTQQAVDALARQVAQHKEQPARAAALDLGQAVLDLQLRYTDATTIDRARFDLWLQRLEVDATAGDEGPVAGDLAVLEWIRDRFAHTLDPVEVTRLDTGLEDLRELAAPEDLPEAAKVAAELRSTLARA